jgi:hypothetical protein
MTTSLRRFVAAAILGFTLLGPLAPAAHAQVRSGAQIFPAVNPNFLIAPGLTVRQHAANLATLGQGVGAFYSAIPSYVFPTTQRVIFGSPFAGGSGGFGGGYGGGYVNPYLTTAPYGGYGGYGGGSAALSTYPGSSTLDTGYYPNPYVPYYDPLSGYLRGAADLTTANANYELTMQKARLSQQQVYQAMIETRHKMFEERRYEQMHTPNVQDAYEAAQALDLRHAQKDPPAAELYSGRPLNTLLRHLITSLKGPVESAPLGEDVLKNVNVRVPGTRANFGLLKNDKNDLKSQWPMALQGEEYAAGRKALEGYLPEAVQQIKFNPTVDRSLLKDVNANLKRMNDTLLSSVAEIPPSQFIEARRFLNQLEDAVKALEDPKAGAAWQDWKAKGRNAAELVNYMKEKGLEFAPATPGDEWAYQSLYQALRGLDVSILDTAKK